MILYASVKITACSQAAIAAALVGNVAVLAPSDPVAVDVPFRVRLVGNRDGVKAVHRVPPPLVTVAPDFAVPARLFVGAGPRVGAAAASCQARLWIDPQVPDGMV